LRIEQSESSQEISIYKPGKVSAKCFALNIAKIKSAFPKLTAGWYKILEQMIDAENFTDGKLNDAVYNLIRHCQYPEPTIANIVSFDKTIKTYLYDDLLKQTNDFSPERRKRYLLNYSPIKIDNETRYVLNEHVKYFIP